MASQWSQNGSKNTNWLHFESILEPIWKQFRQFFVNFGVCLFFVFDCLFVCVCLCVCPVKNAGVKNAGADRLIEWSAGVKNAGADRLIIQHQLNTFLNMICSRTTTNTRPL